MSLPTKWPKFDAFVGIDWSGAAGSYAGIAVARCEAGAGGPRLVLPPERRWTRTSVAQWLISQLGTRQRLLIGIDFAFSFPFERDGFLGGRLPAAQSAFSLWDFIDDSGSADQDFGATSFLKHASCDGLFWRSGPMPQGWLGHLRRTETECAEQTRTHPQTVYKLIGSKQVGKASITGIRVLKHVRKACKGAVGVWPFEPLRRSTLVEVYPTLFRRLATGSTTKIRSIGNLNRALEELESRPVKDFAAETVTDDEADALISAAGLRYWSKHPGAWTPAALRDKDVQRAGWIFGVS